MHHAGIEYSLKQNTKCNLLGLFNRCCRGTIIIIILKKITTHLLQRCGVYTVQQPKSRGFVAHLLIMPRGVAARGIR